jgi:hypothetical protein
LDDEGMGIGEGMEIGIGLNEEYNFTLLFDFDFVVVSGAAEDFELELEAFVVAFDELDLTGLTMVSYIPTTLMSPLLKTIDLIQLFDSVLYVNLSTPPSRQLCLMTLNRRSSFFFWYQSSYRGWLGQFKEVGHHGTRDGCRYRYDAFLSWVPNN